MEGMGFVGWNVGFGWAGSAEGLVDAFADFGGEVGAELLPAALLSHQFEDCVEVVIGLLLHLLDFMR